MTSQPAQGDQDHMDDVPDLSEMSPERRELFDQAARNAGFQNIEEFVECEMKIGSVKVDQGKAGS